MYYFVIVKILNIFVGKNINQRLKNSNKHCYDFANFVNYFIKVAIFEHIDLMYKMRRDYGIILMALSSD